MLQVASIFSQLLQQFPRSPFQKIVFIEKAERHAKGFRCWDQFTAMLFCHIAQGICFVTRMKENTGIEWLNDPFQIEPDDPITFHQRLSK